MTVAGKINALVIIIAVVAACLMIAATLQREYSTARDLLLEQSSAAVRGQPQLQVAIYHREQSVQQSLLQDLLN